MSAFGGKADITRGPNARSRLADSQFLAEWKQTVSSNWCPHLSQDHMFRTQRSCTCSDHSDAFVSAGKNPFPENRENTPSKTNAYRPSGPTKTIGQLTVATPAASCFALRAVSRSCTDGQSALS